MVSSPCGPASQLRCAPDESSSFESAPAACSTALRSLALCASVAPMVLGTSIQEQRLLASGQRTSRRVVFRTCIAGCKCWFFCSAWFCSRCSRVGFSLMKLHSSVFSFCLPRVTKLTDSCHASVVRACLFLPCVVVTYKPG